MAKCEECKKEMWDIIVPYIMKEEGRDLDLYQCKNCKRVVCDTRFTVIEDTGER